MSMREVLNEVAVERNRQDKKWGVQTHHPFKWISILSEEVGEAAQGLNRITEGTLDDEDGADEYRTELVQVAAVAVAAIEDLDRQRATARAREALVLEQLEMWRDTAPSFLHPTQDAQTEADALRDAIARVRARESSET